jgi:hypothetical protein
MLEFQRTSLEMTCRFLETQQRVMLEYLAGGADAGAIVQTSQARQTSPQPLRNMAPPAQAVLRESPIKPREVPPQPLNIEKASELSSNRGEEILQRHQSIEAVVPIQQEPQPVVRVVAAEDLISSLIEIISERTGYPPEMLDPALDLEADLGIDSIKRVEVLNSFRKLLSTDQQQALEDGIEELAGMKTLQSLTDWIRDDLVPRMSALQVTSSPQLASQATVVAAGDLSVR